MSFISNQLPRRDHDENIPVSFSENEDGPKLGKLFFTIKYSFEKNALIVTVNKCSNLPVKDSTNKTRLGVRISSELSSCHVSIQRSLRQVATSTWETAQGEDQGPQEDSQPRVWWRLHFLRGQLQPTPGNYESKNNDKLLIIL